MRWLRYSNTLAKVRYSYYTSGTNIGEAIELRLQINMQYYNNIDFSDGGNLDGDSGGSGGYLDRTLAHELTHAVMASNITGFACLPNCLKEGAAELVHGIDDYRTSAILSLALASNCDTLKTALSDMRPNYKYDINYAGGYMLLRYFAKQSAENYGGVLSSGSSNIISDSVSDSIASAASMLWSDDSAAMVADTGSELSSSMIAVSNALLTPLDSTGSDLFGADTLSSGLFSDTEKNKSFLG